MWNVFLHFEELYLDLDGTIAQYKDGWQGANKIGDPFPGAQSFVNNLVREGWRVVIFSTRVVGFDKEFTTEQRLKFVRDWLVNWGFSIQVEVYLAGPKPAFTALVDDRAIGCRPEENANAFIETRKSLDALKKEFEGSKTSAVKAAGK